MALLEESTTSCTKTKKKKVSSSTTSSHTQCETLHRCRTTNIKQEIHRSMVNGKHNNVLVERADIQDMEFHVDLEAVVADFVSTPSDIKDVLASVDSDDVAAFVAAWLNDEYNSGEFVPAIRHIMYANTMLDLASLLIAAAEQELEDGTDVDPLCVEKMVAEELAKRGHTEEMQKVLSEDDGLAEALKQQLFEGTVKPYARLPVTRTSYRSTAKHS